MLEKPDSKILITPDEGSWVGSLIAIGAIVGSIPAGKGADIFGRKPTIAALAVPFIISWAMIYFATSVWELYVARLIAGAVIGGVTATVPMYIGEIAESSIRGIPTCTSTCTITTTITAAAAVTVIMLLFCHT